MKISKRIAMLLLSFVMLTTVPVFAATAPTVKAESAILIEATTGKVLFEKDANKKMYPASMTKLITAIVALDYLSPEDVIVVGSEVNEIPLDASKAGHINGESITVENLLRGLIIPSGNDSAEVLACVVAKKYKNDVSLSSAECGIIFAELMNKKAKELGCIGTNFANPHGYHDENHYTTASDLAKIAVKAVENPLIMQICGEKNYIGSGMGTKDAQGLTTNNYSWGSHNALIMNGANAYPYATGLKTGFTNEAGDCVTASAQKDGVSLISVIFKAEDPARWEDAVSLFNYGFENYTWNTLATTKDAVGKVFLHNHNKSGGDDLDLVIKKDIKQFAATDVLDAIKTEVKITNELYIYKSKESKDGEESKLMVKAPVEEGTELGTVSYTYNGETLSEAKVYAGRTVEKATIIEKIGYTIKDVSSKLFTLKGLIGTVITIVVIVAAVFLIRFFINKGRRPKSGYKFKKNKRGRF